MALFFPKHTLTEQLGRKYSTGFSLLYHTSQKEANSGHVFSGAISTGLWGRSARSTKQAVATQLKHTFCWILQWHWQSQIFPAFPFSQQSFLTSENFITGAARPNIHAGWEMYWRVQERITLLPSHSSLPAHVAIRLGGSYNPGNKCFTAQKGLLGEWKVGKVCDPCIYGSQDLTTYVHSLKLPNCIMGHFSLHTGVLNIFT